MGCSSLFLCLVATFTLLSNCVVAGDEVSEWLNPDQLIEFDSKEVPHTGLLNRLHWTEKNERSTSKNYSLWEKADVYLLEWPGNITRFDPKNPLVTWGKRRAKYLEDHCALEHIGIEMRVYAYNYVYLTWGPYRLTRTYTTPLTVPRSILHPTTVSRLSPKHSYKQNELSEIEVHDIAFAFDTLLMACSDGVIRVSGLEMAWAEMSAIPKRQLEYSLSQGINGRIDKIITQSCCVKTQFCPYGDFVVAYREYSIVNIIYTSNDGGKSFQKLMPHISNFGSLRLVLSYPEYGKLIVFNGNATLIGMSEISLSSRNDEKELPSVYLSIRGKFQGSRLGMETSFVIWDKCSVWYSPDTGMNMTRSLFYVHKKIRNNGQHLITSNYCHFGKNSALAYGSTGTFTLLDSKNVLFLGIDSKTNMSQLIGLKVDMSLLATGKELSVTPMFDTTSQQPKLMYPPKFLELPKTLKLGKSYKKRLGMRILPKNVYPSDFILSFFEENVRLPKAKKMFSLKPCQTSSLRINNSITQKPKLYYANLWTHLNFSVGFNSKTRKMRQLHFEPSRILDYMSVLVLPESIDIIERDTPQYLMRYRVLIKAVNHVAINKLFRVTFFTKQDLRCNYQPRVPVFIKVVEDESSPEIPSQNLSEDDMTRSMYLKSVTAGETQYLDKGMVLGETMKVDTCPFSK